MRSQRDAERKSFELIPETCPGVSELFDRFCEQFKNDYTFKFREVLTNTCMEVLTLQDKVSDLESELDDARGEIESLTGEINELRNRFC